MRKPTHLSSEYSVDELGNVYGKNGNKLKPSVNIHGYQIVNFMIDGKRKGASVHQLVANAFIPNPDCKPQVNHKDGNTLNNSVDNLEWVTAYENTQHAMQQLGFSPGQSTKKKIVAANANTHIEFESVHDAARWVNATYGVRSGLCEVWRALNGRRKSARGFKWSYIC